ncbi:hypothetical protein EH31_05445 [Erythrobacter longus]|uniref:Autotransporter domain-containing protein n=1 Tax=Erythrobacter longus TaxID=1044 RepID=A0A074MJV3_ERYLO|nr:autotransporter domain-containing protein [Erythrobacter longus]KEO92113.1 hypothetical protein EH31_05445 [Erythrobacter longus]
MSKSAINKRSKHGGLASTKYKLSISSLALMAMWSTPAFAQQTVPGVDPECPIVNGEAICEGDLAGGVNSQPGDPEFDRLIVQNADAPIAPPGIFGIGVSRNTGDIDVEVAAGVTINTFDDVAIPSPAQGIILFTGTGNVTLVTGATVTTDGMGEAAAAVELDVVSGDGNLSLTNTGDVSVTTSSQFSNALLVRQFAGSGDITIENSGALSATSTSSGERDFPVAGILAQSSQGGGAISVTNSGAITVTTNTGNFDTDFAGIAGGIVTNAFGEVSDTDINNSGDIALVGPEVFGIVAATFNNAAAGISTIDIVNSGAISGTEIGGRGINAQGFANGVDINVENSGDISLGGDFNLGIFVTGTALDATDPQTTEFNLSVTNTGAINLTGFNQNAIFVANEGATGDVTVNNSGDITASGDVLRGIGLSSNIGVPGGEYLFTLVNEGDITLDGAQAQGITVFSTADDSAGAIITNSGNLDLSNTTNAGSAGLRVTFDFVDANANGATGGSSVAIVNSGNITMGTGSAITVAANPNSANPVSIENTGALITTGANSHGINVTGATTGNLELDADITTAGAGSNAVRFIAGPGQSATSFFGVTGATFATSGADSDAILLDLGPAAVTIDIENSTITTAGDNSDVLFLGSLSGTNNPTVTDTQAIVRNSALSTAGADSHIINIDFIDDTSIANVFIGQSTLSTAGAGSTAIILDSLTSTDVGTNSGTLVIEDTSISSTGENAGGIQLGNIGPSSVLTIELNDVDIITQGSNGFGLSIGNMGNGSARDIDLTESRIVTAGANSDGISVGTLGSNTAQSIGLFSAEVTVDGIGSSAIEVGTVGGNSVHQVFLSGSTLTTRGASDATAVRIGGATGLGGRGLVVLDDSRIAASGAASHGLEIENVTAGTDSMLVSLRNNAQIEASGAGSNGLLIGSLGETADGVSAAQVAIDLRAGTRIATGDGAAIAERAGSTIETTLTIAGTLTSTSGLAADLQGGDDTVIFTSTSDVSGIIDLGSGNDTILLNALSSSIQADGGDDVDSAVFETAAGSSEMLNLNDFAFTNVETFEQRGTGILTIGADGSVFSDYRVVNGQTFANANLANVDFLVEASARLGGNGTIGNLSVLGGTLAPGNSIGSLTTGNLLLDAASTFEVEVNENGTNDTLRVVGTVNLQNGTLSVLDMAGGNFAGNDPFNFIIIDNDLSDAVNGTFGTITNELAFLTPTISYVAGDGNDVQLTLTANNVDPGPEPDPEPMPLFPTAANTFNQAQAAMALDDLDQTVGSDSAAAYMAILFTTGDQARRAFDTSSGEIYSSVMASAASAGLERSQRLLARSHEGFGEGWGIWGNLGFNSGEIDADDNAATADRSTFGGDLGIDYRGAENEWAAGLSLGWRDGDLDVDDRGSEANYDGWSLGAYARYGDNNAGVSVSLAADYSSLDASVSRTISIPTQNRSATSSVDVDSFAFSAEGRFGFAVGDGGLAVGPLASVHLGNSDLGRVQETGAGALNLSGTGDDYSISRFGGGLFANWTQENRYFDIAVQYVDGTSEFAASRFTLEGAPGTSFQVRSPLTDGQSVLLTVAGGFELGDGWSLGAEARGNVDTQDSFVTGSVSLGWRF